MNVISKVKCPLLSEKDALFTEICRVIHQRSGLVINETRHADLLRVLYESPPETGDWLTFLRAHDIWHPLWQQVIQTITIGETYFFRNTAHFDMLRHMLLPDLIAARRKSNQKYLRLWSTGCATGEEPYSLAMLLHDLLPDMDQWLITILATDINTANLETARRGVYRGRSFRKETPADLQARWFTPHDGHYRLHSAIRQMVNFKPLNLIEDNYPDYSSNTMNMDLVLCRNVTIYFKRPDTMRVIERLYRAITSGGWLLVGHSEPQRDVYDAFKTVIVRGATLYHKTPVAIAQPVVARRNADEEITKPAKPITPPPLPPEMPPVTRPSTPDHDALWHQAKAAADTEDWVAALALLDQIQAADVLLAPVHYLRALIYTHTGDAASAQVMLRQAIYCEPDFVLAHYALGDLYRQANKPSEARRHWRHALKVLTSLEPTASVPYEQDLTVEALRDLMTYQMKML